MASIMNEEMYVIKRNGETEIVAFDKILNRIRRLGKEANLRINYTNLVMKVIDQLYDKIPTTKLDELCAEQCASLASTHPDYDILAGRIVVSNHHKNTDESFSAVMQQLYDFHDIHGNHSPIVSHELISAVNWNREALDSMCDYSRDYLIDYFGFKTLERAYLMKLDRKIVERPQHMWLRVALGIHIDPNNPANLSLDLVKETYDLMSQKYFTHATPTLFNAGTPHPQLSSCYLIAMENDSIDGIYNTLKDCALISKWAGGIGLHIHNIRAAGTHIRGTNGSSNGIVPMLRVFNNTAKYVDQCLTPKTILYTTDGPKHIRHTITGKTQIFGREGKVETIENVLEHQYQGKMLSITTDSSVLPLKITPEHPVYVLPQEYELETKEKTRDSTYFMWKDARDVRVGDIILTPVPQFEEDVASISNMDCYMYGIIYNSGSMARYSTKSFIELEPKIASLLENIIYVYFEEKCIRVEKKILNNGHVEYSFDRTTIIPFKYSDMYAMSEHKAIHSRFLNLPREKILYILKGIIESTHFFNKLNKETEFSFFSFNDKSLKYEFYMCLESIRYICLRLGFNTISKLVDQHSSTGELTIPMFEPVYQAFYLEPVLYEKGKLPTSFIEETIYDNIIASNRINKISEFDYDGIVYDLQMKTEHNYITHMGLVHNGGGRRNGSFAIYLEPWHADIQMFLQMRKNHGDEELKARDLFYALWIPDLFMQRVKSGGTWTLMCPHECPGLSDVYGDEFAELYTKYESENRGRKMMPARDLWFQILDAQMETGTPYILYKDAANKKSNQKNLGTIKSSNLCVAPETLVLTDQGHIPIIELAGKKTNVWNGREWSEVQVFQTGRKKFLITIIVKKTSGETMELHCTPQHQFYVYNEHNIALPIDAADLRIGMQVMDLDLTGTQWEKEGYSGATIMAVINSGRISDTYCFTEPKRHLGVFNGILTGQCTEIIEYSDKDETAVCNLASIALPTFVEYLDNKEPVFNYDKLRHVTRIVTRNLNKIIDVNFYPTPKTRRSNLRHRPIGLGVQGLADVFFKMNLAFGSEESKQVNRQIFETIYYGALQESCLLARELREKIQKSAESQMALRELLNEYDKEHYNRHPEYAGTYSSFVGSPASEGILQFDMWGVEPTMYSTEMWNDLKQDIRKYGLRNSLLVAPMPTASTSQILGFNECIEPITSNIYSRRTLAGEFILANKYLMNDLIQLGLWDDKIKNNIIANNGSIQHIDIIPVEIREKYRNVWEIPMRNLIDMSADRGAFICQSQSLNLWLEDPNYNTLTSMHFYSWSKGLKTGIYYLRRRGKHQAQQFTIEPEKKQVETEEHDICEYCSA